MTGLTMIAAEVTGKRLGLLKEALPKVNRVAVLWNPANRDTEEQVNETRAAARSLGIQIEAHAASAPAELDGAFVTITQTHVDAFFVLSDAMFGRERRRIAALAARSRVPGMYHLRTYVDAGGLISVRSESERVYSAGGDLHRQDPQGGQACRPPRRAAHQVRASDQHEDGQSARPDDPTLAVAAG
jgi:ABC-type uncharacterized transport system substrate-binding protein